MSKHQEIIEKATAEIDAVKDKVAKNVWRLNYHVLPQAYWMNDPNGFIYYKGEYHLFYQHHPFSPRWGPMYWGHVKSKDLVFWEHLPIALAPSENYDKDGCFSGSAIEKDGKLYLMYTGNVWTGPNQNTDLKQVQCLAVSDNGIIFEKLNKNPVIAKTPNGNIDPNHFRDPKVWEHEDCYYCVLGSKTMEEKGQILLYRSKDLVNWDFINISASGEGNSGFMWECPDIFSLGGKDLLVMSPQGVKPEGDLYHNLHQAGYVVGQLNYESGILNYGDFQLLDYGFDFYAPQTTIDDQGRRIMIAWMAMWESKMPEQNHDWAGAMTLPRQLTLVNGRLLTPPVQELMKLRDHEVRYNHVIIEGKQQLPGIDGECFELEIRIDARQASSFGLELRVNKTEKTVLLYERATEIFSFNRNNSGEGPKGIRKTLVPLQNNQLLLRIYVDHSSVEVFINNGEKVMTGRIYPKNNATKLSFFSNEAIELIRVSKWSLKKSFC